jgi:acetyl-CoA synthetase
MANSAPIVYFKLWKEVNRFANVLKSMGVKKGDTVTIYMGRVPELPIAMLATAKIGAIHSVVYGGFSEQALADRITDAQSKIVITCDGAWLRGKTVNLKDITDEAVAKQPGRATRDCLQAHRSGCVHAARARLLVARSDGAAHCQPHLRNRDDGFGRPALHPLHIGHHRQAQRAAAHLWRLSGAHCHDPAYVFDLKEEDRYWCAADPGWITGHSYIVYAPLILGATSFIYEGAPGYPFPIAGGRRSRNTTSRSSTLRPRQFAA